jgi:hypothetical protein
VTIHLGTTNENKVVYGSFPSVTSLTYLLNASTSAANLPQSIDFQNPVVANDLELTAWANWTGQTTFEDLTIQNSLPGLQCAAMNPDTDFCRWTVKAKKVTIYPDPTIDADTRWSFDEIRLAYYVWLTWDVRSFSVTHLHFSRRAELRFTFPTPAVTPIPTPPVPAPTPVPTVPPPPAEISGEFDLTDYTRDSGFETIVRQHNGSIYSEFSLGTSGGIGQSH